MMAERGGATLVAPPFFSRPSVPQAHRSSDNSSPHHDRTSIMARRGTGEDFTLDKALPNNVEAERFILGAILLENTTLNQAAERLKPEDFFLVSHRRIFEKMLNLFEAGRGIDPITLQEELRRAGEIDLVGGPAYLASLFDGVPRFSNIENYVKIVKGKSTLRRLINASNHIMAKAFDDEDSPEEILDEAERLILAIAEDRIKQGFVHIGEVAAKQLEVIEEIAGREQLITGIATGFSELDYMTSGLQRGDLIIVAARPSMGKTAFSLGIAQNAATSSHHHGEKAVVGIFSLEMSNEQLVNRLLCSQARVDAHRLRSGYLSKEEWRRLAIGVGELSEAQIFLDDTPGISVLEMRAKARRLKNEQKRLDVLIVDYLQLMTGRGRTDSRQQEVSQISRELKMLAKELNVPLIALSQLSRAPETRTGNHKPQLSDLRESGCLTGDARVTLADSGRRVSIRDLVGRSGFTVWALNEHTWRIEPAIVSSAFSTGMKPVFRLTTRLGRTIRATGNHPFRAFGEWKRLDGLAIGDRIAVPRSIRNNTLQTMSNDELALLGHLIGDGCTLPRHAIQYTTRERDLADLVASLSASLFGDEVASRIVRERQWYQVYLTSTRHHTHGVRSSVAEWLDKLGIWGLRSYEKWIPEIVFEQPPEAIAIFIRHLWVTDGCIKTSAKGNAYPAIYYASSSPVLAGGVQSLLLRIGVNARLTIIPQVGKGRDQYHVRVSGKQDIEKFIDLVGAVGAYKIGEISAVKEYLATSSANTNRDVIPREVWRAHVVPAMKARGITARQMMANLETAYCGTQIYQQNLGRERALRLALAVQSDTVMRLAESDVYWDEIASIQPDGVEEVYDLTVENHHNFVADDIIVHNSIEQDADVVMFIYREEVYKPETEKQNIAEIIIGKQRNGPIGSFELVFLKQLTRFEDKFREHAPDE
ncbi:MAG: replicative DNA helicase [Blastocatellia bacterium]